MQIKRRSFVGAVFGIATVGATRASSTNETALMPRLPQCPKCLSMLDATLPSEYRGRAMEYYSRPQHMTCACGWKGWAKIHGD